MEKLSNKILFIATVYSHLAAFHKPFMLMLKEMGYEVHAAASPFTDSMEELQALGIHCWEVPFTRSPYNYANIRAFKVIRDLFKNHKFELIHAHTPVAAFIGRYIASRTFQGSVLYTAHGFHFYSGAPVRNWLIYYPAERIAVRWTDGLIVMNTADYELAQRMGFIPKKNLFFVNGVGVDLSLFDNDTINSSPYVRRNLGISQNATVVACVAELNENKNQIFLLKAWQILSQRINDIHLLLVGDGQLKKQLEQFVRKHKIPRVYFLGYRKDIPEILQETDILALVSKREGLPRCIMEAMAAGKPVVATDVRGSRDLIVNGNTGFLVGLHDVHGLVKCIEELANNLVLRDRMGMAARDRAKLYSLETVKTEMLKIYKHYLIKQKP